MRGCAFYARNIAFMHVFENPYNFDQKYKFSNKNDMVSTWRNFQKKNLVAYLHMTNPNETLSHNFHFDRVSDSRIAHVLGLKGFATTLN